MDNSKYWKDMHISTHEKHETTTHSTKYTTRILSKQQPIEFRKEYDNIKWDCHLYTQELHDEISDELIKFVNDNNRMYTGMYELISKDMLETFIGLETHLLLLRYPKTNKIMGAMISIIVSTTALKKTKFALTTYLCIHKKLRGNALCMMVIRNALKKAHSKGIFCSYYLQENPFSMNAISVERWMRPINVENALKDGFEFGMPPKHDRHKYKYAYLVSDKLGKGYSYNIVETNKQILESFKFIYRSNTMKDRTDILSWIPTKKEWKSWCKSKVFDTLVVSFEQEIIGVVTVQKKQIFIPETEKIVDLTFIPYHFANDDINDNDKKTILESAIIHSKKLKMDMIFMFEGGIFSRLCLESNKAISTGEMYIDFYNYRNPHSTQQIFTPLL